jgi:hypothetical protein
LALFLSLLEILLQPPITLGHVLLARLVTILFLLQHKQQIFLPVVLQTAPNLLLASPDDHETAPAYADRVHLPESP